MSRPNNTFLSPSDSMIDQALQPDAEIGVRPVAAGRKSKANRLGIYFLCPTTFAALYSPEEQRALTDRVHFAAPPVSEAVYLSSSQTWTGIEMIFSGWGMTTCDERFLERFPDLKIIFHAGGTIRPFMTEAFWERGLRITGAAAANAVPVAEYTLSQILFGLKQGWQTSLFIRRHHRYPVPTVPAGAYNSVVGLISLGQIGSLVARRLLSYDIKVIAFDPYISEKEAGRLGVEMVSLEELFRLSDVVSCHAPDLEGTRGMIRAEHFAAMKRGATFINTARGRLVDETGMIEILKDRDDLIAVLDVTAPEPPVEGSPLYTLENVVLTPHIAGSLGVECSRMGRLMVEELDRYLAGQPLRHEIIRERAQILA